LTGRQYTYAESRAITHRFAASLRRAGFKHGDVLAVVLPNIPEFPFVLFGAIEAGMVVTTINPGFTSGILSPKLWRVAANILNKQLRIADKSWSSSLGVGQGANSLL
jgi:acyl-CoA synthetase (AMP-forming)/AMP-acid ligase II